MFDIEAIRSDFPALNHHQQQGIVYLDSAATSQKPQCVIDAVSHFYENGNANVHRGAHRLSSDATKCYEQSRAKVAQFINCHANELVWTKGATEAINLVAYGLTPLVGKDEVILISELEHHANIVPWQQLAKRSGASLRAIPVDVDGIINTEQALELIKELKPKVLAISHASNALGNIQQVETLIKAAKAYDAFTLVDGAQSLLHLRPDVKALDCDFFVFSAHKCLGPTGIGGLYGRYPCLEALEVFQTGGEMVTKVSIEQAEFNPPPGKFETGTPNIAGVVGFGAAIDYLSTLDMEQVREHEMQLFTYLHQQLAQFSQVRILGDLNNNIGTISFVVSGEHPYDLATLMDMEGIALRHGHHCAQPLMAALGVNGTVRVSLAFYNNQADVDAFIAALANTLEMIA
ncbi:cysteine desulfurase [Pseudoalteromonas sp. BDTF-M6]|uniref:aminotransferase class V-fold PLP-dependent enzyme n=1 Tax=Pseudoalteromonas sp. BDTF-M6 TaxID=2796132 RepID=UPI001BAEDEAF|nr:cysteine desulfurase [Pseudoalteromonas sp. BDTF-M6]MBS3796760.1 cysteine desulfurase [Pseudoalteromonas sp. BDTF-M6]